MFLRKKTITFTEDYLTQIIRLKNEIKKADVIVIGAGAGLSTSAGFIYNGARFTENFSDFEKKYGFHDMYTGGFYPFETKEEYWGYWSRFIFINRYMDAPKPVYEKLLEIVKDKDYFVLTTNVDHQFQKAGFDKKRLFYTQGDFGLFQCVDGCDQKTYDNEEIILRMVEEQKDGKIPSELIPKCPVCGKYLTMNLRADSNFVEDKGWREAAKHYEEFIQKSKDKYILFLELGVGFNTPIIIKYRFWEMTSKKPKSTYACINLGDASCPNEIANKSICINSDIEKTLIDLLKY